MIALALALLLQTAPAPEAPARPPEAVKAKPVEDKIECHEQVMTGSHFSSRTCLRHSEWARLHDESVEALAHRNRDSNASSFGHN